MTAAIIYYSFEGHTEKASLKAAELLEVPAFRITTAEEPPRKGPGKYFGGGADALKGKTPAIEVKDLDLKAYDTLILACPVWAGTYAPAMGSFLKNYPFTGKKVYLIASSASGKADRMLKNMENKLVGNEIAGTLSLKNPGSDGAEIAKVGEFCRQIKAGA